MEPSSSAGQGSGRLIQRGPSGAPGGASPTTPSGSLNHAAPSRGPENTARALSRPRNGIAAAGRSPLSGRAFDREPASAARKHSTGATATPAPTWPLPSETWRMPVLIRGVMPVSTTRRTSTAIGVPRKSSRASLKRLGTSDADLVHVPRQLEGVGHRPADEAGHRRRTRRRRAAEADQLEQRRIADVGRARVGPLAGVVEGVAHRRRRREVPLVRAGQPHPERRSVAGHADDDARSVDVAGPRR